MSNFISHIMRTKTFALIVAVLIGAVLGATGLHSLLAGMAHDFAQIFGIHNFIHHHPTVHVSP